MLNKVVSHEMEQEALFSSMLEKIAEQGPIFTADEEYLAENSNEQF